MTSPSPIGLRPRATRVGGLVAALLVAGCGVGIETQAERAPDGCHRQVVEGIVAWDLAVGVGLR